VPHQGIATPLILVVAVVLTRADGRVLLARRPEGKAMAGLWELPGGKLEAGERPEAALIRELREELAVELEHGDLEPWGFASHGYETFHLLMPVYRCRRWKGAIEPQEGQGLAWVHPANLESYPAPAADIPLFRRLAREA
jgi:8-oxo-dGTP diphosphatase